MGKVLVDLSMSLDGFITGPNPRPELPLGEGGQRLHDWMFPLSGDLAPRDREMIENLFKTTGAIVKGSVPSCQPKWTDHLESAHHLTNCQQASSHKREKKRCISVVNCAACEPIRVSSERRRKV
jgi:hypothetical protein